MKLKDLLLSNDTENLGKLAALLEIRIDEGHGETIFELGVENNGDTMGLTKSDWDIALKRLIAGAKEVRSDCQILYTKGIDADDVGNEGCHGKMLIRQHPASVEEVIETRIAVVGNVDAGKSTMLVCNCFSNCIVRTNFILKGVLVKGGLDDGRGKARVNLFRHKHVCRPTSNDSSFFFLE